MFIQEADLFKGLDDQTVSRLSKIMVEESYDKGAVLYTESSRADSFYILWEGRVRLTMGTEAEIEYTVSRRGEVFGWSSLIDRNVYTACAECVAPTKVFKIDKEKLEKLFEQHPEGGITFYKRLAGAIHQRLMSTQNAYLAEGSLKGVTSFGSGQVASGPED